MKARHAAVKGFTLIELMVTLALVAILMAIAVPSLRDFQRNAQLTSFANNMLATINSAKSEAMKRGGDVVIVPSDGLSWANGMRVFVSNKTLVYAVGTDTLIQENTMVAPNYLTITPNNAPGATPPYIRFDAQGYLKPVAGLKNFTISIVRNDVTGSDVLRQTRYLKAAITGRMRVCTPASSTDTTCTVASAF